jgi:hypothetical protein
MRGEFASLNGQVVMRLPCIAIFNRKIAIGSGCCLMRSVDKAVPGAWSGTILREQVSQSRHIVASWHVSLLANNLAARPL